MIWKFDGEYFVQPLVMMVITEQWDEWNASTQIDVDLIPSAMVSWPIIIM
jgi:hypothetical protein